MFSTENIFKTLDNFILVDQLKELEGGAKFAHQVYRVKKKCADGHQRKAKHDHIWYLKQTPTYFYACVEMLSQEFARLISPRHPKTRIVYDSSTNTYYVISKEVPGYTSMPAMRRDKNFIRHLRTGAYKGLGEILILLLWLNENDSKIGNIGFNFLLQFVKIDGEQSFAQLPVEYFQIMNTSSLHK